MSEKIIYARHSVEDLDVNIWPYDAELEFLNDRVLHLRSDINVAGVSVIDTWPMSVVIAYHSDDLSKNGYMSPDFFSLCRVHFWVKHGIMISPDYFMITDDSPKIIHQDVLPLKNASPLRLCQTILN